MPSDAHPPAVPPIGGATRVLFLLADPIAQARAPGLVNAALARRGLDAVLVPLATPRSALPAAMAAIRAAENVAGAVVSMPHKEAVLPLLDARSPDAEAVGAANVVARLPDGRLEGYLLDGLAMARALAAAGVAVRGRRVHVAGAGGAGGAITRALAAAGAARLTVANRSPERAEALAARLHAAGLEAAVARAAADDDVIVNATSLGMRPDDPLPVDPGLLRPGLAVADVVVTPSRLLALAAERGCATVDGVAMLAAQVDLIVDLLVGGGR